ncbi:MAG: membrane integrity-associated transporter subunit PqiC [Magnetococcales bacterium]|nr:membrane integrity-associated transporter subunit PqiC [Magnetococcales bacterium]
MTARPFFLVLSMYLVAACAALPGGGGGGGSSLRHFLLTPLAADTPPLNPVPAPDYTFEVVQVTVPPYLNRTQIVTRPGPNELYLSETHQWGDALPDNLTRTLAANLAHLLANDRIFPRSPLLPIPAHYRLVTEVDRFDQDADGSVVLALFWRLFPGNDMTPLTERRALWRSAPVAGTDYGALVAAMSRLWGDYSQGVAREVARLSTTARR